MNRDNGNPSGGLARRDFLYGSLAAAAAAAPLSAAEAAPAAGAKPAGGRRIRVGIVGCGGRGSWIAGLFKQHGGYEFVAAADYFPDRAQKTGTALGADRSQLLLRPVGLQAAHRQRRRGRDPRDPALLLPPARRGRRRGRPARLHGQARGGRRAGHAQDRQPGPGRRPEEARLPGRLPNAHRSDQSRSPPAIPGRGPGQAADGLHRGHGRRGRHVQRSPAHRYAGKPPDRPDLGQRRRDGLRLHRQLRHPRHRRPDLGPRPAAGRGLWPGRAVPPEPARRLAGHQLRHLPVCGRPAVDPRERPRPDPRLAASRARWRARSRAARPRPAWPTGEKPMSAAAPSTSAAGRWKICTRRGPNAISPPSTST